MNSLAKFRGQTPIQSGSRFSLPQFGSEKKTVSLALGLICEDAIVFAAESQTTRGNVKSLDAKKLTLLNLDKSKVIVGSAGHVEWSGRVVEILQRISEGVTLSHRRTMADLMKESLKEARNALRSQLFNCSAEELKEYILKNELQSWFLAGHYFQGEPLIYVASLALPVCSIAASVSSRREFAAIGTGAELADYLLEGCAGIKRGCCESFCNHHRVS